MKKLALLFTILISFSQISCSSKDDDNNDEEELIIMVNTSNAEFSIDENPVANQEIGTIEGTTNEGSVTFSIVDQNPSNAFTINQTTGVLTVLDETAFDFETTTIVTGIIEVANGDVSENAALVININDIDEDDPTVFRGDALLTTQEEIDAFGANGYITIDGNLTIDEDQTISNIIFLDRFQSVNTINGSLIIRNTINLLDLAGLENITSVGGLVIEKNPILDINGLVNIVTNSGNITITNNSDLEFFCGLLPLIQNGDFTGNYEVSGNFFNPTLQQMIDGDCED